jgi:hypothetical protein
LSTRASLEQVGGGRNNEATARATESLEQAEGEVEREREGGSSGSIRPNRYAGFDHFGLTSGPRGILVFSKLVKMQ